MALAFLAVPYTKIRIDQKSKLWIGTCVCVVIMFCISIAFNQPLIDSSLLRKDSSLYINESVSNSLDIEIDNLPVNGIKQIGIIRNLSDTNSKIVSYIIDNLDSKNSILLTSDITSNIRGQRINNIAVGFSDNQEISKLISSDIGIIEVENTLIRRKWQRDFLNIQKNPTSSKYIELASISICYFVLAILILVILISLVRSIIYLFSNIFHQNIILERNKL